MIGPIDLSGVNPRSFITNAAKTSITHQNARAYQEGDPEVGRLRDHPAEHRAGEHGDAGDHQPLPNTDSRLPVKPVNASASTSQASTAPEKNVNPSPSRIETIAHHTNGACQSESSQTAPS